MSFDPTQKPDPDEHGPVENGLPGDTMNRVQLRLIDRGDPFPDYYVKVGAYDFGGVSFVLFRKPQALDAGVPAPAPTPDPGIPGPAPVPLPPSEEEFAAAKVFIPYSQILTILEPINETPPGF